MVNDSNSKKYRHSIARVDNNTHTTSNKTLNKIKMSGFGDEHMENTDTTFKDMPIEHEVDGLGVLEIYRKMMLIDLFQTHYGGWVSNLPLHIKVLMAALLVMVLTVGIYSATVNLAKASNWMDETYQNHQKTPEEIYKEMLEILQKALDMTIKAEEEYKSLNYEEAAKLLEQLPTYTRRLLELKKLELLELHENENKLSEFAQELKKKTVIKQKELRMALESLKADWELEDSSMN